MLVVGANAARDGGAECMTAKVFETAAQKWSAQMTKTTETTFKTARRSQTALPTEKRGYVPRRVK